MLGGTLAFVGYLKEWNDNVFIPLLAPPIYLTHFLKNAVFTYLLPHRPVTSAVIHFAFLLPITVIYFGFVGFLMKKLWNETGVIRFLSIFVLTGFLIYIHYQAGRFLLGYLTTSF